MKHYRWFNIGIYYEPSYSCCSSPKQTKTKIIDIMAPLIQDQCLFLYWLADNYSKNTLISLNGELKQFGDGKPPSNFRTKDINENNNAVHNLKTLIMKSKLVYPRPVFINNIPRENRLLSFYINNKGEIITKVDAKFTWYDDKYITKEIMNFLWLFGINEYNLIKIKESSKGKVYKTYFMDMISLIYKTKNVKSEYIKYFDEEYRIPIIYTNNNKKEIYMDKVTDDDNLFSFMKPKEDSIENIYIDFVEAISKYDNPIKRAIRHYVNTHYIQLWSDFNNDIAFSILMIIHAYRCKLYKLTKDEDKIVKSIEKQMVFWFDQL